jgi:hypothetical protein
VTVGDRILAETPPGSVTAVVGRPGAGVSALLDQVCMAAPASVPVVLASWERSPGFSSRLPDSIVQPEVIGWSSENLAECAEVRAAGPGAVVAVDYLQLLSDNNHGAGRSLRELAETRSWRLVLGVMAPRKLRDLGTTMSPAAAVQRTARELAHALRNVDRAVVIGGGDVGVRSACLASPTPSVGAWRLRWAAPVGDGHSG